MLLILFIVSLIFDQSEEIVRDIQEKYDDSSTIFFRFKKTITDKNDFSATTTGEFWFKQKHYFKYMTEENIIMTDTKTSWDCDLESKQVKIDNFNPENQRVKPSELLLNYSENYVSTYLRKQGKLHVISLVPKRDNKSNLAIREERITIWVNEENLVINRVEKLQKNGNLITYEISDVEFNRKMTDSDFQFKNDQNYELIDLRF